MKLKLLRVARRELFFIFYKKKFNKLFLTTRFIRRALSLTTCLVFILTSIAPAQILDAATTSSTMAPLPKDLDLSKISIPENLGFVVDQHIGNQPDQLVIQIEDAHTSYDAQRNIQRIIDYLERQYGLGAVAFEGAEGELDPFIFRAFPDREAMEAVLDSYIRLGELSGVDLAAAVNLYESRYFGIEDQDVYDAGIAAFLDAQKASPEALRALHRIEEALTAVQRQVYSPQLKEISEKLRDYEYGRLDLGSLLMFLKQFGDPPKNGKLSKLFSAVPGGTGKAQEIAALTSRLDAREILREVRSWAESVKEKVFKTEREIKTDDAEKALYLLKDLASLQMAPEQLHDYFSDKAAYTSERFQTFLTEMGREGSYSFDVSAAVLFYRNAMVRDQVLAHRLITLIAGKKYKVAAFVSGGFHTPGISERLRAEGVSYVTVMPNMGDMNRENHYLDVMRGDISYSQRFEKNSKGEVDLYKAFAEDVTERMARQLAHSGAAAGLREWRDAIVRSLVAQGKAVNAHRYTYFIDKWVESEIQQKSKRIDSSGSLEESMEALLRAFSGRAFSQYRRKILNEFNELLERMKSLDSAGSLDVANFSKLLGLNNSSIAALASHPTRPGFYSIQGRRSDDWLAKIPERFEFADDRNENVPVSRTLVDSKPVTGHGFGAITVESVSEDLNQLTLKLEQWRKIAQQNDFTEEANSLGKLDEKMKRVSTRRNVAFSHLNLARKLLTGESRDGTLQRDLNGALYHLEQAIDRLRKEGLRIFRLRASIETQEWIPLSWAVPNTSPLDWDYQAVSRLNSAEEIGKALVPADLQLMSSRQIPRVFRWSGPEDSTAMFRKREQWPTPRYLIKLGQHLGGLSNVATHIQILMGEPSRDMQPPQENLRQRLTADIARLVNELDLFQLDFEQWSDVAMRNQFEKRILAEAFKRFRGVKQLVIKQQFAQATTEIQAIWQRLDAATERYRQSKSEFEVVVVPKSERKPESNLSRYGFVDVTRFTEEGKRVIDSTLIRNFSNLRAEIENIATGISNLAELKKTLSGTGFGAAFPWRRSVLAAAVGLAFSACNSLVSNSGPSTDQIDDGIQLPGDQSVNLAFEDLQDETEQRAIEPFSESPFTPDSRFEPPASERADDIGLVFEEANAIRRFTPNFGSGNSSNYVVARVTTSADIGRFENVFISHGRILSDDLEEVTFSPVDWRRSDYDYGNPAIQPPLPDEIPLDYRSFSQINLGGRIQNGDGSPVLFDVNAIGYAHTASASARESTVFGTSLRWLFHFGTQGTFPDGRPEADEAFPELRNIYIVPSANSQVTEAWMTFSTPAYEAVIQAKFYQGSPSFIAVKGTLIPRRDIPAREKVGIGGFSSFFGSNERYGDFYHDYDRIVTIGKTGKRDVAEGFHPDEITLERLSDRVDGEKVDQVFLEQNNRDPQSYRRGANYQDRASMGIQFPKAMIGNREIPLEPYFYTFPVGLGTREYVDSTVVLFAVASDLRKGVPVDFEYTVQTYRSNPSLAPFDGTLPESEDQSIPSSLVETLSGLTNALPYAGQVTGNGLSAFADYDARPQGFYTSEVSVPAGGRRFAVIPVLNRSTGPSTFKIEMPGLLPEAGVFLNKYEPAAPVPADGEWYLLAAEIEPDGWMTHFAVSDISAPFRQYGLFLTDELPESANVIRLVPAGFGASHSRRDFVLALAGSGLAVWAASALLPKLVPLTSSRNHPLPEKKVRLSVEPNMVLAARYREAAFDFINRAKSAYEKSPEIFERQFGVNPSGLTPEHYRRITELYMFTEAHESGDGQFKGQVNSKGKVVGPGMSPASIEYQSIAELLSRHQDEFKELLGSEWTRYQLQAHVLPSRYFSPSYLKKRTNAQIAEIRALIKAHGMEVGRLITDHLSLRIAFIHVHYFNRALARSLTGFDSLYPDSVRGIAYRWARDYNGVAYHTMDEAGAQKWSPKTNEEKDIFMRRTAMVEQFEERAKAYRSRAGAAFYETYFSERTALPAQPVYAEVKTNAVQIQASEEMAARDIKGTGIARGEEALSDMTELIFGMSRFEWVTGLLGATATYIFSRRAYIAVFGETSKDIKGFGSQADIDAEPAVAKLKMEIQTVRQKIEDAERIHNDGWMPYVIYFVFGFTWMAHQAADLYRALLHETDAYMKYQFEPFADLAEEILRSFPQARFEVDLDHIVLIPPTEVYTLKVVETSLRRKKGAVSGEGPLIINIDQIPFSRNEARFDIASNVLGAGVLSSLAIGILSASFWWLFLTIPAGAVFGGWMRHLLDTRLVSLHEVHARILKARLVKEARDAASHDAAGTSGFGAAQDESLKNALEYATAIQTGEGSDLTRARKYMEQFPQFRIHGTLLLNEKYNLAAVLYGNQFIGKSALATLIAGYAIRGSKLVKTVPSDWTVIAQPYLDAYLVGDQLITGSAALGLRGQIERRSPSLQVILSEEKVRPGFFVTPVLIHVKRLLEEDETKPPIVFEHGKGVSFDENFKLHRGAEVSLTQDRIDVSISAERIIEDLQPFADALRNLIEQKMVSRGFGAESEKDLDKLKQMIARPKSWMDVKVHPRGSSTFLRTGSVAEHAKVYPERDEALKRVRDEKISALIPFLVAELKNARAEYAGPTHNAEAYYYVRDLLEALVQLNDPRLLPILFDYLIDEHEDYRRDVRPYFEPQNILIMGREYVGAFMLRAAFTLRWHHEMSGGEKNLTDIRELLPLFSAEQFSVTPAKGETIEIGNREGRYVLVLPTLSAEDIKGGIPDNRAIVIIEKTKDGLYILGPETSTMSGVHLDLSRMGAPTQISAHASPFAFQDSPSSPLKMQERFKKIKLEYVSYAPEQNIIIIGRSKASGNQRRLVLGIDPQGKSLFTALSRDHAEIEITPSNTIRLRDLSRNGTQIIYDMPRTEKMTEEARTGGFGSAGSATQLPFLHVPATRFKERVFSRGADEQVVFHLGPMDRIGHFHVIGASPQKDSLQLNINFPRVAELWIEKGSRRSPMINLGRMWLAKDEIFHIVATDRSRADRLHLQVTFKGMDENGKARMMVSANRDAAIHMTEEYEEFFTYRGMRQKVPFTKTEAERLKIPVYRYDGNIGNRLEVSEHPSRKLERDSSGLFNLESDVQRKNGRGFGSAAAAFEHFRLESPFRVKTGMASTVYASDLSDGKRYALHFAPYAEDDSTSYKLLVNAENTLRRLNANGPRSGIPRLVRGIARFRYSENEEIEGQGEFHRDAEGKYAGFVVEFIDGENGGSVNFREGWWKDHPDLFWSITLKSAEALRYLHEDQGLVHRDVKPQIFLVERNSPENPVTLIDFETVTPANLDLKNHVEFMAVTESFSERTYHVVTPDWGITTAKRYDIFSWGATLYNWVTGRWPNETNFNMTPEEFRRRTSRRNYPPAEGWMAFWRNAVKDSPYAGIILKAMDLDSSLRYQSMTDAIADLKKLGETLGYPVGFGSAAGNLEKDFTNPFAVAENMLREHPEFIEMFPFEIVTGQIPLPDNPKDLAILLFGPRAMTRAVYKEGDPEVTYEPFDRKVLVDIAQRISKLLWSNPAYEVYFTALADRLVSAYRARGMDELKIELHVYGYMLPVYAVGEIFMAMVQIAPEVTLKIDEEAIERGAAQLAQAPVETEAPQEMIHEVPEPSPAEVAEEEVKVKGDAWSKFVFNRWRNHFTQALGENVALTLGDRSSFTLDFGRRKISYQQFADTVAFEQAGEIWGMVFHDKRDKLDIAGIPIGGKFDVLQIGMNLFQITPLSDHKSIELKNLTGTGLSTLPAKITRKQGHTQYAVSLQALAKTLTETLPEFSGFVRELVKHSGAAGKGFGTSLSEPPDSRQLGEVLTTPGKSLLEPGDLWWRSNGFTTPGAFRLNGKVYLIARGIDEQGVSRLGLAVSADGHSIEKIWQEPIFVPAGLEQGVENPRVTVIEDEIYMLYTARRGRDRFQLELASISKENFLLGLREGKWESKWRRHDIEFVDRSRRDINDRNAAIFPQKIGSEYVMYFRDEDLTKTRREIRIAYANQPDGPWDTGDDTSAVLTPEQLEKRLVQKPESPIVWVGVGGPPLLTKDGWFTVFHYVDEDRIYRMGFFIADRNHPNKIIYLHDRPIWELGDAYYDLAKSHQLLAIPRAKVIATMARRINRFQLSGFFGLVDVATFRRMRGHDVPVGDRYTLHVSGIIPEFEKRIIQPGDPVLLYGGVFNTDTGLGIFEYPELGDLIARETKKVESETTILSGKKILVVEDTEEIRDEIVKALREIGKVEANGGQIFAPATKEELQLILEQAHSRRLNFDAVISDHEIQKFGHIDLKRGTQVLKLLRDIKGYIPPTIYYSNRQSLENLPPDEARTLAGVRRIMKEIEGTAPLRWMVSPKNIVRQDLPALLRAAENLPAQPVTVSEERIVDIAYRLLGPSLEPKRKSLGQLGGEEFPLQEIRLIDYGSKYMNEEMLGGLFGGGLVLVYAKKPVGGGENLKEGDRVIFVHQDNNVVRTGLYDAKSGQFNFVDRDVNHKLYFGPKTRILYRTPGAVADRSAGEEKGLLTEAQKKLIKDHFQDQKDPLDERSERILAMIRFVNVESDSDEFAPHLDIVKALFARTKDDSGGSIDGLPHGAERYIFDIAQKQGLDLTVPGALDRTSFILEQIAFFPKATNRYVDLVTIIQKKESEAGGVQTTQFTASRDRRMGDEHSEGEFEILMKYKSEPDNQAPFVQSPYGFVEIGHSGLEFPVIFKEYVPGEDIDEFVKRLMENGVLSSTFDVLLQIGEAVGAYVGNYYGQTQAWPTDVAWRNLVIDAFTHPKGPFVARPIDLDDETYRDTPSKEEFFALVSLTGDEFFEWAERQNNLRLNSFLPKLVGQMYLSMVKEMIRVKPDVPAESKFESARTFLNDLLKYLPAQAARGHREVIKDVLEKMRTHRQEILTASGTGAPIELPGGETGQGQKTRQSADEERAVQLSELLDESFGPGPKEQRTYTIGGRDFDFVAADKYIRVGDFVFIDVNDLASFLQMADTEFYDGLRDRLVPTRLEERRDKKVLTFEDGDDTLLLILSMLAQREKITGKNALVMRTRSGGVLANLAYRLGARRVLGIEPYEEHAAFSRKILDQYDDLAKDAIQIESTSFERMLDAPGAFSPDIQFDVAIFNLAQAGVIPGLRTPDQEFYPASLADLLTSVSTFIVGGAEENESVKRLENQFTRRGFQIVDKSRFVLAEGGAAPANEKVDIDRGRLLNVLFQKPAVATSKASGSAGFGTEIFDGVQLFKDREEIFNQAMTVLQSLPASVRPLGKGGKPGGLIFSSDTDRLFVVGDLHGRARPNLEIILRKIDYEKSLKNPRNKLVILGDAVHYGSYYINHPNPAVPPLAEAKAAYLDSMLGMLMIADLIRRYPGQVFYFPGNHDYAHVPDNRGNRVLTAPYKNNENQGEAFEAVIKEYFGPEKGTDLLNRYSEFVRSLPLIGRFGPGAVRSKDHISVSVVHAGPSFAIPGLPPELRRGFEIGSRADMIDLLYYAFEVGEDEFGRDKFKQRVVLTDIIGQLLASRSYGQSKPLVDMRDQFNAALETDFTLSGHTIPNDYAESHGVEIIMDNLFGRVGNQQLILDSQNGTFAYMDLDLLQPKPEHLVELLDGSGTGDSALKFDFASSGFGSTQQIQKREAEIFIEALGGSLWITKDAFVPADQRVLHLARRALDAALKTGHQVLDLGAGPGTNGIIAAQILKERGGGWVYPSDVVPEHVRLARRNLEKFGLGHLAKKLEPGDLFEPAKKSGKKFNVVIFNPPWWKGEPVDAASKAYYDSGDLIRRFFKEVRSVLDENDGHVIFIYGNRKNRPGAVTMEELGQIIEENNFDYGRLYQEIPLAVGKTAVYAFHLRPKEQLAAQTITPDAGENAQDVGSIPILSAAPDVAALLDFNPAKVQGVLAEIRGKGFGFVRARLERELIDALKREELILRRRLSAETGLKALAGKLARDPKTWTPGILRADLEGLGIVIDDTVLGDFALLVNRLRFTLERFEVAEHFEHYALSESDKREIEERLDSMRSIDPRAFQLARQRVMVGFNLALAEHRFSQHINSNAHLALGYEKDAAPGSREAFERFVLSAFGGEPRLSGRGGKLDYFYKGDRGILSEISFKQAGKQKTDAARVNHILSLIDAHQVHDAITPANIRNQLDDRGALVVSSLNLLEGGTAKNFPTGRVVVYPGRSFDESDATLSFLSEKVDEVAKLISQGDQAANDSLLRQIADYGFAFRPDGKGGQFIFVDRAAFVASLELAFAAARQTAAAA